MIDVALRTLVTQHATPGSPAGQIDVGSNVMPVTEAGTIAQVLPKVVYTLISAPRGLTDSGPVRLITARYQLDIYAATLAAARSIASRLSDRLHGYTGTVDETRILLIAFDDDSFDRTNPAAGANTAAARVQQDVFITYRE